MAKEATKTAAKPRARKPAAARAPARTATAADRAATTAAATEAPASKKASGKTVPTATIRFDKTKHGGNVRGAVNGQRYDFPVGPDVTVTKEQLESLQNSNATFETITPLPNGDGDAAEGSAASSTIGGTANRLEPANTGPKVDKDGKPLPAPQLLQTTDKDFLEGAQTGNLQEAAKEAGGRTPAEAKAASGEAEGGKAPAPAV